MDPSAPEDWQRDLTKLAESARSHRPIPARQLAQALEAVRRVDPGIESDVELALIGLLRIVDAQPDAEVLEATVREAIQLALASLRATEGDRIVRGLARQLHRRGMTDAGLLLLGEALRPSNSLPDARGRQTAAKLHNLVGELLRESDRLFDAEQSYQAALAWLGPEPDAFAKDRSVILNNLGQAYAARGDLREARRYLLESLRIATGVDDDPLAIAVTVDNLGSIESSLAREAGPLWIADGFLNEIVDQHLRQAQEYFERAGTIFAAGLPETAEDYARNLLNFARAVEHEGDRAKLDLLSQRAFDVAREHAISPSTSWEVALLRGDVLLDKGEAERAAGLLTRWFGRLLPHMEPHERISRGLDTLLRAATAVGDQDLVDSVAGSILENEAVILPLRLAGASTEEARKAFRPSRNRARLILGHCLPTAPSGVVPAWLYEVALNTKGVLGEREGSAWLNARNLEGMEADLLSEVRALRSEVATVDLDGSGAPAIGFARHRHEEAERKLRHAERELQRAIAPWQTPMARVSVGEVQAQIPGDAMLLDLMAVEGRDGSHRHVLFLVGPDGPVRYRDLGEVGPMTERLHALIEELETSPADTVDLEGRPARLRGLTPAIFGEDDRLPERLLVAATGSWGLIPFGILPDPAGRPLLDEHIVTMIPSARWLSTRAAGSTPTAATDTGPPTVLGDPDFDLHLPDDLPYFLSIRVDRLPESANEVRDVADLLGVEPVVGAEATRRRLLDVRRPRLLHLACHGVFLDAIGSFAEHSEPRGWVMRSVGDVVVTEDMTEDEWFIQKADESPNGAASLHRSRVEWIREIGPAGQLSRSALLLTGFNAWLAGVETPADVGTGMISAGEFALLDLAGTDLVVLSACETGVGAVDVADGSLMGLRTAALAAGAGCCVSTLWSVEDEAATKAMSSFYRHLESGDDVGHALRAAQLTLRQEYGDPYFWAGWVAEGVTGSIRVGRRADQRRSRRQRDSSAPRS